MRRSRANEISPISILVAFLALFVSANGFAQTGAPAPGRPESGSPGQNRP